VTRRHSCKYAKAEQGRPSVEGSVAGRNWQTHPGLYGASLNNNNPRSVPFEFEEGHSTRTTNKKAGKEPNRHQRSAMINKNNDRTKNMPSYVVEELNTLDTMEFQIALDYWMMHLNFTYSSNDLMAYDESIYPDARCKQAHQRRKRKTQTNNTPNDREHALTFACRALVEYSQHQRLATQVKNTSYLKAASIRNKIHIYDENYLTRICSRKHTTLQDMSTQEDSTPS
jgi:hypothetical protein